MAWKPSTRGFLEILFIRSHLVKDDNNMKKVDFITPFVIIVAILQLLISASVRANIEIIEKLDLDKDGQISIKESVADPAVLALFGKIDTDGNGKITSIELTNIKQAPLNKKVLVSIGKDLKIK